MKGQDGYTAAEALAALAILGLAMTGLTTSMGLIGDGQKKARVRLEQTVLERAVDQRLEQILARDAPFRSDQASHLTGSAQSLEVDCGGARRCGARIEDGVLALQDQNGHQMRLRLPDGEAPRFVYIGSYSVSDMWPSPYQPPPAPAWQSLEAVVIQSQAGGREKPLALAKVWRQQRADCEYDVVIQDCRGAPS
jgi:hypothetical protein